MPHLEWFDVCCVVWHLAPVKEGLNDCLLVVQLAQPTGHHWLPQTLRADGTVPPPGHEGDVLTSLGRGGRSTLTHLYRYTQSTYTSLRVVATKAVWLEIVLTTNILTFSSFFFNFTISTRFGILPPSQPIFSLRPLQRIYWNRSCPGVGIVQYTKRVTPRNTRIFERTPPSNLNDTQNSRPKRLHHVLSLYNK